MLYLAAQLAAESSRARQKMFELASLPVAAEPEIVQIAAGGGSTKVAALSRSVWSSAGPNVDLLFQAFD
jgi:hypothetical protein